MGKSAIDSHIKSTKHSSKEEARKNSYGIRLFSSQNDEVPLLRQEENVSNEQLLNPHDSANPLPKTSGMNGLDKYLIKDDVTKAEILWCLESVYCHLSLNAAGNLTKIFPKMFPDSEIASKMQLGRTKVSYACVFGLSPYFHEKIRDEILNSDCYVAYFDESLNKVAQMQQMDIAIRFWSLNYDEVRTHYFTSAFLKRATAADLLDAFRTEVEFLDFKKLLHISMDGPNVNFKFLKDIDAYMLEKHDVDDPQILNMGSCGLHVTNNGLKAGVKGTGWNIIPFLRAIYNLFKDLPSRRNDFITYSGCSQFPKKFCSSRWLENAEVSERALLILPSLRKYVAGVKKDKKEPTSNSYKIVADSLQEKFIGAQLAFFAHVANIVEPFLTEFQSNDPLAPFLYTELTIVMTTLMDMFVKKKVLEKHSNVYKVDLENKENFVFSRQIKIGFSAEAELRKIKDASEKEKALFKNECRTMLILFCQKLLEKSPLKYKLCKAITFCDPSIIKISKTSCVDRLRTTLEIFLEKKRLSAKDCDSIENEFKLLIKKSAVLDAIKTYNRKTERVDHFWKSIWVSNDVSKLLMSFMKKVLLISQGNAFVERGFSINKELVVENQLPKSLVAQRRIYDGIQAAGGIDSVKIDSKMISKFRGSRMQYDLAVQEKKKENILEAEKSLQKKRIGEEIQELKEKKRKIQFENQKEIDDIENQIQKLVENRID